MTAPQETSVIPSPARPNRKRRLVLFIIAPLVVGAFFLVRTLVPAFQYVALRNAYAREVHAIQDRFEQLDVKKPVTREEHAWNGATGWLTTAAGNVFFTPESVPLENVQQYHRDLMNRLETSKPWTLTDTKWAWNRFREAGPAGKRYLDRFSPGFDDTVARAPEFSPVPP